MQAEKTIPKALSGAEIVESIIANLKEGFRRQAPGLPRKSLETIAERIRAQMRRDCYLNPIISYATYSSETEVRVQYQPGVEFFSFQSTSKINFQNTGTSIKETFVRVTGALGETADNVDMQSVDVKVVDEPRPPNQVRVESHQDVPVIVPKKQGGVEEKRVRYAPKRVHQGNA